jgi:nucleoside-diphosphate kinase
MMQERTLSIIKPDAVANNQIGPVMQMLEQAGLRVIAAKMMHMTKEQAEGFYAVHKARPFFNDLVMFMTSGPSLVMVLEGDNAILLNREVMGATDPKKAAPGTIRANFGTSIEANVVHGSDAPETAKFEIGHFFKPNEIYPRMKAAKSCCSCSH